MTKAGTCRRDETAARQPTQPTRRKAPARCAEWHRRYAAFIDSGWMGRLNKLEICVYLCYLSHADNETFEAFPGAESIARAAGNRSRNHVFKARRSLEQHGLLTCVKQGVRGNGGGLAAVYRVESAPAIDANSGPSATVCDTNPDDSNSTYSVPNETSLRTETAPQMVPKRSPLSTESVPQIVPKRYSQLLIRTTNKNYSGTTQELQEDSLTAIMRGNEAELIAYGITGPEAQAIAQKPGVYPITLRCAYMKLAGKAGGKSDLLSLFSGDPPPSWSPLRIGSLIDSGHVTEIAGHSLIGTTVTRDINGICVQDAAGTTHNIPLAHILPESIVLSEPGRLTPLKDERERPQ